MTPPVISLCWWRLIICFLLFKSLLFWPTIGCTDISLVSPHSFVICFSRKGDEQTVRPSANHYQAFPISPQVWALCLALSYTFAGVHQFLMVLSVGFILPFGLIDDHPSMLSVSQPLTHYWSFVGFPLPPLEVPYYPLCFTSIVLWLIHWSLDNWVPTTVPSAKGQCYWSISRSVTLSHHCSLSI